METYDAFASRTYSTNGLYDSRSRQHDRVLSYPESKEVFDWYRHESVQSMQRDAYTLAEMLAPVYLDEDATLAEQVFGNQARHQRLSLRHIANLLNERVKLHKRHLRDIGHQNMQVQELLSGERLHSDRAYGRRATNLERTLIQLDKEKWDEELGFWKDTVELRDRLFEHAQEYQALRHRTALMDVDAGECGGPEYD
jgi:hypothetical protein